MPEGMSAAQFADYLTRSVGRAGTALDQDLPLGEQLDVDSSRLMELSIALELELGMDLPDDVDLRALSPAALYHDYRAGD
ncbi:hypothetical protein Skr01_69070 [Sphaerisporangium krabiense]|uniref:Acyl carrier protein n=1 Tax=Sphaerisporangium krabiense TaxID=763782 RepID=A0A7W8Z6M4_9ACTN|nr:hypothetical protein [Sphaerisporangium krabiense]MBB5628439.1 acyl carrier protein [Sphaerisporangium krabiense]GII66822.1 hypothetical protein Skr01_69070 [Sphaerisporangium krabiense]